MFLHSPWSLWDPTGSWCSSDTTKWDCENASGERRQLPFFFSSVPNQYKKNVRIKNNIWAWQKNAINMHQSMFCEVVVLKFPIPELSGRGRNSTVPSSVRDTSVFPIVKHRWIMPCFLLPNKHCQFITQTPDDFHGNDDLLQAWELPLT